MDNQHLRHTYVPAFDGLRALVLVVMFTHLEGFFPIFEAHRRLNVLLFSQAWYALNVFFCLSGFLITWILSAELLKTGDLDLKRFYKRRTVRLLPAYTTAIAAAAIVALCWGHRPGEIFREMPYFLTYSYNMFLSFPGATAPVLSMFLVPAWSLCVEEQFYLGWSLALKRLTMRRALPAVIFAMVALRIYRCALFFSIHDAGLRGARFYFGTDTRIDVILMGCAAALALQKLRYYELAQKYLKANLLLYLLPLGIAIALFFNADSFAGGAAYQAYGAEITSVLLAAWIVCILFQPQSLVSRVLASPPIVFIGKISYGLYIFHLIVAQIVVRALGARRAPLSNNRNLAGWLIVTAASIVLATAHYYWIEKPLISRAKNPWRIPVRSKPEREQVSVGVHATAG